MMNENDWNAPNLYASGTEVNLADIETFLNGMNILKDFSGKLTIMNDKISKQINSKQ